MKRLRDLRPGFFCPIVPKTYVVGQVHQILHDSFPEIVGEQAPIHLCTGVPLKKCLCVWLPEKDEIAFFWGQHHFIPVDHKYVAGKVTNQVSCVQVCMTDDVGKGSRLEHLCQLLKSGHSPVNRRLMRPPRGTKSAL